MLRVSNQLLFFIVFLLFFLKLIFFILLKNHIFTIGFGDGNDADFYNLYAIGRHNEETSLWSGILRFLSNIGFYNRDYISSIIFFLTLFIPVLCLKISKYSFLYDQKKYLFFFCYILILPTLFYYSLDIYRDIFMLYVFLLSIYFMNNFYENKHNLIYFTLFVFFVYILYGLRSYLGVAFVLAYFVSFLSFSKLKIFIYTILGFILLFLANSWGLFNSVLEYRESFSQYGENAGGSNIDLDFSNPKMFIPNFILSFAYQNLGFFFPNFSSIILFLIECIPFIFMMFFILKNYKDSFLVRFLLIFSLIYAAMWCISNANLGTAVRLRLFNYFAVYICFLILLKNKCK